MPFGVGARTCLGASFGMIQLRIMIALIVQRYRLEIVDDTRIDLKTTVVIGPRRPLPVRVVPQDRRFEKSPGRVRGDLRDLVELPVA